MIRIVIIFLLLLFGCTSGKERPLWPEILDKLPQSKNYYNVGLYTMNDNYYAQFCDLHGNAQLFKYDLETDSWKQLKYITGGCL